MVSPRSYLPKSPVLLPSAPSSFLNHTDDEGAVGLFAPRPQPLSKIADHRSVSAQSVGPMETFFATCSRVVRLHNLSLLPERDLSVFLPHSDSNHMPVPTSLWTIREEFVGPERPAVWAVFATHKEACVVLSLPGLPFSVAPAPESDLEPFYKLRRFVVRPSLSSSPASRPSIVLPRPAPMLKASTSHPNLLSTSPTIVIEEPRGGSTEYYTLSTNPPNPKTSFRPGDWICRISSCAAHNFGRNTSCIGCGRPKSAPISGSQQINQPHQIYSSSNNPMPHASPSPRFSNLPSRTLSVRAGLSMNQPAYSTSALQSQSSRMGYQHEVSSPPKSAHPLLTPSGRAFAIGGKVQNVSSDPLSPCIMYWPDNEPFPEQGQIRPGSLAGVPQPPILNTGNKGPITHQPGDWICKSCNYLNWRRRRVCQTCLPYAEGNGDSISAAVQTDRIALLTSVLAQTDLSENLPGANSMPQCQQRQQFLSKSISATPPLARRILPDSQESSLHPQVNNGLASSRQSRIVHKSQSHNQLASRYDSYLQSQYNVSIPIYQTSGRREASPVYLTGPNKYHGQGSDGSFYQQCHAPSPGSSQRSSPLEIQTSTPLLPSFLKDIIQSPSLSPTSTITTTTSSSDRLFEDEYEDVMNSRHTFPRVRNTSESRSLGGSSDGGSSIMNVSSIWKLDGEESKTYLGFSVPSPLDASGISSPGVIGSGRNIAAQAV